MQGKKIYNEKLFTNFQLSERVPEDNLYRRLKAILNLDFVYPATQSLYGKTGNPSLDPKVFFRLALVGYLENITSDRKLVDHCSMRMDILYFLGYDIDEPLPWHSTISRTRKLFPEAMFEDLFNKVFSLCVNSGMVNGATQCVDSTISHANASKDSLMDIKQPVISIEEYLRKSKEDNTDAPATPSVPDEQSQYRNGKKKVNASRRSSTDPDARVATRPGKGSRLGYLCNVSVDAQQHVITHIQADYADKRDSDCLPAIVEKAQDRLKKYNLQIRDVLADTAYSSGENYEWLEQNGMTAWIPVHGAFHLNRDGFRYDEQNDIYLCANDKQITLRRTFTDNRGNGKRYKEYFSSTADCKACPLKIQCIGVNKQCKVIKRTAYHSYYEKAYHQQNSYDGKRMRRLRSSRVEPVIGTLMNFLGLRKLRVRGIKTVNKNMLLAATVYNLKKYMRQFNGKNAAVIECIQKAILNSKKFTMDMEVCMGRFAIIFGRINLQHIN